MKGDVIGMRAYKFDLYMLCYVVYHQYLHNAVIALLLYNASNGLFCYLKILATIFALS